MFFKEIKKNGVENILFSSLCNLTFVLKVVKNVCLLVVKSVNFLIVF